MTAEVSIVGAGPVGLLLAGELALAGVRPVVLEQLSERGTAYKANALMGQVVRFLDHRGLYRSFGGSGDRPRPTPAFLFGALLFTPSGLADNPLYGLQIRQAHLETLLERRAVELGVDLRRGHQVRQLRQDDEGVTVQVQGPDGGYELRTGYLVGCDGARSGVRKAIGATFAGSTDPTVVSRAAHVAVPPSSISVETGDVALPSGDRIGLYTWHRTERGAYVVVPHEPGVVMVSVIEWDGPPITDDIPVSLDEIRASLRRVLGQDLPFTAPETPGPHLLRRGHPANVRIATSHRVNRVFLAGDAAHVHPAVGAPGLNLGLQDAANLGWKLAAQVHGWAPPGLLDSYQTERRPAAERVTMHTQAQLALMSPGPAITALRQVVAELLETPAVTGQVAHLLAGSDLRYPMHSGSPHPLTGRFAPDLDLRAGSRDTRLAELTHPGRPLLLDLTGSGHLADLTGAWRDRVDLVTAQASAPPAGALLVRPDGYVAWALGADGEGQLLEALETWFGGPAPAGHRASGQCRCTASACRGSPGCS
ncbi:FAD-dependent monooxygenase [Dactylosporangium aurantiacum]|uniref:FAD-dependent monooxygenase n=1 Tax=Dactylosporangium aurantiacum TaxID=35754 RepID=A0A9Q9MGN5_9ACTN|nr:FAD-dependent monooxygenase [Dactylosporangium aurantiacum]MDG6109151.1 FAD-dependent monooxygenase [Dactylosporangium aurantiacum]UWZ58478.1 FAD-dependent monooxygenase [Dactylosporangium aurantiacum]